MKWWVLAIFWAAACQSAPSKSEVPVVEKISEPPTKEERREHARELLAEGGREENTCPSAELYERVIADYGDLPEAKLAKKSLGAISSRFISLQKKKRILVKQLAKSDDYEVVLTERITYAEEFANECRSEAIKGLIEKEAEYYRNLRTKKYGY